MVSSKPLAALVVALGCCGINAGPCKPQSSTSLSTSLGATITTGATRSETSETSGTEFSTSSSVQYGETTSTVAVDTTLPSTLDTADPTLTTPSETTFTSSSVVIEVPSTDETGISANTASEHSSSFYNVFTTTSEAALISNTTTSNAPTSTLLEFFNGGFEEGTELALPWVIGRSLSIEQDHDNAHSGDRYALVRFPIVGSGRPIYPLRQTVRGLDPTKKYLLTFYWTFHEDSSILGCNFYTYFYALIEYKTFQQAPAVGRYIKRQIVVALPTLTSAELVFYWSCWGRPDWSGAAVRIDDVSVVEYDPPCTSLNAQSEDLTCGRRGYFASTVASSYLIDFPADWISVALCAQACVNTQSCRTFMHAGTDHGLCKLYSATPQQLDFRELANGGPVYEPACFQCGLTEVG